MKLFKYHEQDVRIHMWGNYYYIFLELFAAVRLVHFPLGETSVLHIVNFVDL